MRRLSLLRLGAFLVFACLALTAAGETVRLRADGWMPFNGRPQSAHPGYAIEVLRQILARHDIALDYQSMPWTEALQACAEGRIDAVVGANTTEAAKLVLPAESIGSPRVGFFIRADNRWIYQNIPSLVKVRLGVIQDYKYFASLDTYIERHKGPEVVVFPDGDHLADAIQQLVEGKIDVLAEVYPVFAWTARSAGLKPEQFRLAYLHEAEPVYFAFAPGDNGQRFAILFDAGLRELRASGALKEILKRYGQEDWAR